MPPIPPQQQRESPSALSSEPVGPGAPRRLPGWLTRRLPPWVVVLVLGGVYGLTLLPGAGYSPDTAEMQFSGRLLCVTHPTGNPTYLLLLHAFSRLFPVGSLAFVAPGLPVYCTWLDLRPALRAAGLAVQMVRPGVFRIEPGIPGFGRSPGETKPEQ